MANMSTNRVEPTGARFSLRHGLSGKLAALLAPSLYILSLALPVTAADLVSVNTKGYSGNAASSGVALNQDGSVVAFFSDASDLVPNDTNYLRDVFVRDLVAHQTERVSVDSTGEQANGASQPTGLAPPISDDGRFVAFYSLASNLVDGDNNNKSDVFVRDRLTPATILVSATPGGGPGDGASRNPSMSSDGRFVAFESEASDLVDGDTKKTTDIFVRDLDTGLTERLCNVQLDGNSNSPAISANGDFVAFVSSTTTPTGGRKHVYLCDRTAGTITLISQAGGVAGNGDSMAPAISGDGSVVVFKSDATNLVVRDTNGATDIFAFDRLAPEGEPNIERISVKWNGVGAADAGSFLPTISRDGRFVVFGSDATNLVPVDVNQVADVFIRDRQNDVTLRADRTGMGEQPNGGTPDSGAIPAISADLRTISFASAAFNWVWNDFDDKVDVIVLPNPFLCGDGGTCPPSMACSAGFCQPLEIPTVTPTPTITGTLPPTATPTVTPTPTASATPTPTIPCFVDTDCPVGQVCDPTEKVCEPAPTATPKTPCADDTNCPAEQKCVEGFCELRITPTPTITPTPLPTCTTDEDCTPDLEGTPRHCRAGVCVPVRPCEDSELSQCRGDRETCVVEDSVGVCECLGDCNTDGLVLGNEIANMVCHLVYPGQDPSPCASDCLAGFKGGELTGSEICAAVQNLRYGCPAEGQPLQTGQAAAEPRSLDIGSASGAPGTVVTIAVDLSGGGDVATAQMDLLVDSTVLEVPADGSIVCTIDPRLSNATDAIFTSLPQTPGTPPGMARIRLFVANFLLCQNDQPLMTPFDAGPVFTCQFRISPFATPGTEIELEAERVNIGDPRGNEFDEGFTPGTVTVTEPPVCGTDVDCPGGTHCREGKCVPIVGCDGPSQCPGGNRETCVEGACECVGDCNLDGNVFVNEITLERRIAIGQLPLSECPAADSNLDGEVFVNEITLGRLNAVFGCPLGAPQP